MGLTIKTSQNCEESDELKALALRFFSFNDNFWVQKTEKFMEFGNVLKDLHNDIEIMLDALQSDKPPDIPKEEKPKYGVVIHGHPLDFIRSGIDEYSVQGVFTEVLFQASRCISWGSQFKRKTPHVEAMAWIAYFAKWDENVEKWIPSKNWVKYYNDCYSAIAREQV